MGERDRADVGGPGPGWEAPGRRGWKIPHALQLAPGSTAITAFEQGRRLCPCVDGPVGGRDGDGGDPGVFDPGEILPRPSSVLALEDTLVRGADVKGVRISGIQRQAPGAAPIQPGLDATVLYHGHGIFSCHVQSYHGETSFFSRSNRYLMLLEQLLQVFF